MPSRHERLPAAACLVWSVGVDAGRRPAAMRDLGGRSSCRVLGLERFGSQRLLMADGAAHREGGGFRSALDAATPVAEKAQTGGAEEQEGHTGGEQPDALYAGGASAAASRGPADRQLADLTRAPGQ